MKIITKKEAKLQGLKYYYTGKPCKNGHNTYRLVIAGACRQCKLDEGTKYRNNNRVQIREYSKKYNRDRYTTEKRRESYKRNIKTELICAARHRAKKLNMNFDITVDDIIIPDICPILGIRMDKPTLDRKHNDLGYIKGNVFVISMRANRIKSDATIEEIENILKYMKG